MHISPKKILIIAGFVIVITLYIMGCYFIVLNVFTKRTVSQNETQKQSTIMLTETPVLIPPPPTGQQPTSTPTPTPTPLLGPGKYACDKDSVCGDFSDQMRTYCPKTFADRHCLGMCGTPAVRCSQ